MIKIQSNNSLKDLGNQVITKVKSIIITTDAGDIIFTPTDNASVSLTTTEEFGLLNYLSKKEVTVEAQYDNMIVIK